MADDIIQFSPGGKVTAEETNENNLLLKEWALDNSQSQTYIDGKIATLTTNLNSQISSLNNQISSINGQITSLNNNKISATKNGGGKGYIKFSNNITIQWGTAAFTGNKSSVTISLLVPFSNTDYRVTSGISTNNEDGNEQNWIRITDINQSSFKLTKYDKGTVHWIAIGG
jgi:hypothetical protein